MEKNIKSLEATVEACPIISKIAKPLFQTTPIKKFCYAEYHLNGDVYYFNQNRTTLEEDIEEGSIFETIKTIPQFVCKEGFMITDFHPNLEVIASVFGGHNEKNAKHLFGHECEYVFREANSGKLSAIYFYSDLADDTSNSFYLNNTSILKYFTRYFLNEFQPFLKEIPPFKGLIEKTDRIKLLLQKLESAEIPIPDFLLSLSTKKKLSKRQLEIIKWYLKGKTAVETAQILEISPRTVEAHINAMKEKLNCRTKAQILNELLRDGLCLNDF